jgi:hypothetical protein
VCVGSGHGRSRASRKPGTRSRSHAVNAGEVPATSTSPPPGPSSLAVMTVPSGRASRTRSRKPSTRTSQAIAAPGAA